MRHYNYEKSRVATEAVTRNSDNKCTIKSMQSTVGLKPHPIRTSNCDIIVRFLTL